MALLRVQLFGHFSTTFDGVQLTTLNTPRLQILFAYLILNRTASLFRYHLAYQFWPDSNEAQARTNLRNLIHLLRQALPNFNYFIRADAQTLQWREDAPYTLDVLEFEQLLEGTPGKSPDRECLDRAVTLYQGDLLPSCYEEWIIPKRERLHRAVLAGLEALAEIAESSRDYTVALEYTRRLLQIEPLHAVANRQLIRLCSLVEDRPAALKAYQAYAKVLEHELDIQPDQETQDLYAYLKSRAGQKKHSFSRPTQPVLVGRQTEWHRLQAAWRNAASGSPQAVFVTGEAGIGKTRLVEELVQWASRLGIHTAVANCYPAEGSLPYAPVVSWLRSQPIPLLEDVWLTEISRLMPEVLASYPKITPPKPLKESWQRLRLFEALARAIIDNRHKLLLVIEDIHWCDQDTLEWLHYLLRFDTKAPILVVATERDEETTVLDLPLQILHAALAGVDKYCKIKLTPLNETESFQLATQVAEQSANQLPSPERAMQIYEETEGNPLFVVEMVQAGLMENQGWMENTAHEVARKQQSLPEKMRQIIEAKLAKLQPATQELAGIAAAADRVFSYQFLSLASNFKEEDLVRALDELWRRRIIREDGKNAYNFSHNKIRLVVYEQMSTIRQRFCHRKIAEALEKLHTNDLESVSAQIAAHYEQAGLVEKAILHYQLAAQVTQRLFANQNTIHLIQKGLQLLESEEASELSTEWVEETQARLFELQGDILARTGNHSEACLNHQRATDLVAGKDNFWQARLQRKIGNDFREQFDYDQAVMSYQRAQASIEQPPLENARDWWWEWIELQLDQSLVNFYLSHLDEVIRLVERLKPVIEQYGTAVQHGRYYRRLVTIKFRQQNFVSDRETIDLSRKALATIKESDDLVETASAYFGLGLALICSEELDEAEEQIQAALELAKQTGQDLLSVCFAYLAVIYRKRGKIETVLEYARRIMEISTPQKDPIYFAMAKSAYAWAAWRQKQYPEVEQHARQALAIWHKLPDAFPFRWLALWPLLGSSFAQDQIKEAIGAAQALFGPHQQLPPTALATILNAAIQSWSKGQLTDVRHLLKQAVELAINSGYL